MGPMIITDKTFEKGDCKETGLEKGEYENCNFNNCDFSNTDFSEILFVDCSFTSCNLSLVKMNKTVFRDITFKDCKLLGLRFDDCSEFGLSFSFDNCTLNHSSFYQVKIKKTLLKNSQLQEVDFTECDLTNSVFDNCNLAGAAFENTILEKADFRTSYNYSIDPEMNRIKKARFSLPAVTGLLNKYDIVIDRHG